VQRKGSSGDDGVDATVGGIQVERVVQTLNILSSDGSTSKGYKAQYKRLQRYASWRNQCSDRAMRCKCMDRLGADSTADGALLQWRQVRAEQQAAAGTTWMGMTLWTLNNNGLGRKY
jgi:hypothetical protein